jgi:branched-chain amino acid transport system substrate-binding protein
MRARRRIGALVVLVAVLAAACSSGGDEQSGPRTVPRPRGPELVIGYLGQETGGPSASGTPPTEGRESLAAWVAWTNDHGGVHGRPVRLVTRDGGGKPDTTAAAVKALLEVDHAIAIVGQQDTCCLAAWADDLKTRGVPVIGGQVQTLAPLTNPMVFAQGASVVSQVYGQVAKVKAVGKTVFGHLYCTEQPACAEANDLLKTAAAKAGVQFAFDKAATANQDFTAACLAAKSAGVEVLQLDGVAVDRVTRDCARQGYLPVYGIVGDAPAQLEVPELEGAVGTLPAFPAFATERPTADFRAAMKRYAPKVQPTVVSSESWLAGLAVATAVGNWADGKGAGARPTSADVLAGLLQIKDETFGGLTPPITYGPAGSPNPTQRCFFLIEIKGGRYVTPKGLKPGCEPA